MRINKIIFILLAGLFLTGCRKQLLPTTIEIKDPVRHYYPIKQGQDLAISIQIRNTGMQPLVIKEIQTSCGCISVNEDRRIIVPVDGKDYIRLKYNSTKNVGLVSQTVWIYGNITHGGVAVMNFDVNVVPDADYTRDYEHLYEQYNLKNGIVRKAVDGDNAERQYYIKEP